MLVVFKSAPILKRTLKVKHAMLQVHTMTHFMVHFNSFFSSCMFWNCWRCRPSTLADSGGNQTWKQWAPFIQRFLQQQWTYKFLNMFAKYFFSTNITKLMTSIYFQIPRWDTGSMTTGPLATMWTQDLGISRQENKLGLRGTSNILMVSGWGVRLEVGCR